MSDEMVQEKTETPVNPMPENGRADELNGAVAMGEPVSSSVVADAASTAEPAPAQPVALEATASADEEHAAPVAPEATATAGEEQTAPAAGPVAAPSTGAPSEQPLSDDAAFEREMQSLDLNSQFDRMLRPMQEGDVVTGTVMRVDREGVLVDVGAKSEGIIRMHELSRDSNIAPETIVKVGDRIKVFVLEPENQDGNPILSKKRADFEQAWDKVQQSKENGETIIARVTDRVKGGLVVDLGIRGFVPASHVGNGSPKTNLDKYIGQEIPLKVIEVDKERRKVVLSNKQAAEEERRAKSEETKNSLQPGQRRHGTVRRLTNYGAFIDLGGIDGLLHISEMSWTRINDPKEVLKEGQDIEVIILKMDLGQNRVSLGLRQILPDPWAEIAARYKEGDVITGQVTRLVPFGAVVQVDGGVEGVIPHAEVPRSRSGRAGNPGLAPGEEVTVKVIGVRPEERKMTLSLKALLPPEEREVREVRDAPREGAPREGAPREGNAPPSGPPREPAATGGGKRERPARGRENDDREEFARYTPSRQEEPRFTMGEAFEAARKQRAKRDRRVQQEEEEYVGDLVLEDDPAEEATEETPEE